MRLKILDRDPHDPNPSLRTRIAHRLLGDPSNARRRLMGLVVFVLLATIVVGVWAVIRVETDTGSSSYWFVTLFARIFNTAWVLLPLAFYLYWKYFGILRKRYSRTAADTTGWLAETIEHLSDEMRSTDGTTRVITTTDQRFEEIRDNVDAALRGESHDGEAVDYFGRYDDGDESQPEETTEDTDPVETPPPTADVDAIHPDPIPVDGDVLEADAEPVDADRDDMRPSVREVWADADGYRSKFGAVAVHGGRLGFELVAFIGALLAWPFKAVGSVLSGGETPEEAPEDEWNVPWKVRFAEELKHLLLDLGAAMQSDELLWKFGLPTGVTFISLLMLGQLWVHPILYLVFAAISILVGLLVFWVSKKRRSRRLRVHRQPTQWSYWNDAAGRVKTVETADVTCYMGWQSGRRYASYNREEFVHEFSLRLYQRTHDERVSPSVLEKYARNLAQMKPNLRGHLEHIERPAIQQEIKHAVETSHEQVVDKAGLALDVIEHPTEDKRISCDLGHDPRLVAEEYRWLVEEGHVLSEIDVEFEDASGRKTTKTLVYPSSKQRLPDVEALHSQFSDRFTGAHGDPFYTLPECDPTDNLRGFVPTPRVAKLFQTEGGA
ncbi:hypothetical protein [Halomontanus rarus]|uniref:hypothetical protein n=1 Tax=Halomontanus rarus TaxID=3034020 RepID=UPI0023E7ABD7|nr:hypothetical protein [Halovivax sp. TS33]